MRILWFSTHFLFSRLSIVSNNVTGRGLVALAQAVQSNMKLSHIYIWGNKFDRSTCLVSGWSLFILNCLSIVGKITAISEQDTWIIWGFICDYNMVVLEWDSLGISTLKGLSAMSCLTEPSPQPKASSASHSRFSSFQAFSELIETGRLQLDCTDVVPYEVDGKVFLAELSHGLGKHRYWAPRCAAVAPSAANASLQIVAVSEYLWVRQHSLCWFPTWFLVK